MTRTILAALLLTGCAYCPAEYIVCDPVTDICVCTGPTGSIAPSGPDDRDRARAEPERQPERPTEPEKEPETDKEPDHDPEPDREKDPEAHDDWKGRQK